MILVLASRDDTGARRLVDTWGPERARLLTADDLSSPGWRVRPRDPAGSLAVVGGETVAAGELTGVLTRLPAITSPEVRRVRPEDRDYAASEMTAFLSYWLSVLPCPVLNPPTASSLCGPGWRSEQWVATARRLGAPVRPRRRARPPYPGDGFGGGFGDGYTDVRVTVLGGRCVRGDEHGLADVTLALAAAAGVPMLTAFFEAHGAGTRFVDAQPWTDAFDPGIVDALADHFHRADRAPDADVHRAGVTP